MIAPVSTLVLSNAAHNNRTKASSSLRPSTASSTIPSSSDSSLPPQKPQQSVRRYVPAHINAPFLTQPEKKRRPSSSSRNGAQTHSTQRTSTTLRSISQQRRQSSSSITKLIVELSQQTTQIPTIPLVQNEKSLMIDNQNNDAISQENIIPDHTSIVTAAEECIHVPSETVEIDISSIPQPIVLNRALIKPLRRLWKQNQNLRLRLKRELDKKFPSSPLFIDRLNEQVNSFR